MTSINEECIKQDERFNLPFNRGFLLLSAAQVYAVRMLLAFVDWKLLSVVVEPLEWLSESVFFLFALNHKGKVWYFNWMFKSLPFNQHILVVWKIRLNVKDDLTSDQKNFKFGRLHRVRNLLFSKTYDEFLAQVDS